MNLIRNLILKEWFRFFIGAVALLLILLTIANLVSGLLRGNVTAGEVLINHLLELPGSFEKILPVSCLIASIFSINKLKNRNELTAIFASGFSRKNYLKILIVASSIVAVIQFLMSGHIAPFFKSQRHNLIENSEAKFRNLRGEGLRASTISSGKIWYKSDNYFFSFNTYNKIKKELNNVSIFYIETSRLERKIIAKKAVYLNDNTWILLNGNDFKNLKNKEFPIKKSFNELMIKIKETPKDFDQIEADITTLDTISLSKYIGQLEEAGINTNEYKVKLYNTFSTSIICVIFALIASIGIFNSNRRTSSMGKNIATIFIFTIIYWLVNSYLIELGKTSQISAIWACTTVPLVFSLFLIKIFMQNRTLN